MAKVQKFFRSIPSVTYIMAALSIYAWSLIFFARPSESELVCHSLFMFFTSLIGCILGYSIHRNELNMKGAFIIVTICGIIGWLPFLLSSIELGVYSIHWLLPLMNLCIITALFPKILDQIDR